MFTFFLFKLTIYGLFAFSRKKKEHTKDYKHCVLQDLPLQASRMSLWSMQVSFCIQSVAAQTWFYTCSVK